MINIQTDRLLENAIIAWFWASIWLNLLKNQYKFVALDIKGSWEFEILSL